MMNKLTSNILSVSLLALSAAASGCGADAPGGGPGEPSVMNLRVSISDDAMTRALADDPETKVESVALFLFTEDAGAAKGRLYDCVQTSDISEKSGGYCFEAQIDVSGSGVPPRLRAAILCNHDVEAAEQMKGKTLDEISASLSRVFSSESSSEMTMWGVCAGPVETSLPSQQLSATVVRDVARIDVDASKVETSRFELKEVYVYRHNDKVALVGGGTAPSVPAGASKVDKSRFEATVSAPNRIEKCVYIPEADVKMGESGNVADDKRLSRTAIVVGGSYRGSGKTSYYRIDFTVSDGSLTDILRNHRYVAHITAVNGPGSDTPDEAYTSISAGVNATILDWTDRDLFVAFDGAHWFSVEKRVLSLGPDAGETAFLGVGSDIDPADWQMGWNSDMNVLPESLSPLGSLSGSHFKAEKPDVLSADSGEMIFSTLNPLTASDAVNSEVLHIVALGRLHVAIRLEQRDLASSPWEDGGSINGTDIFE